jgi:hypothetical protein
MTRAFCLSFLLLMSAVVSTFPQSLVNVEVESWVYPVLDRFAAKGYIYVDTDAQPLTRGEIAAALKSFISEAEKDNTPVSSADRHLLARLEVASAPRVEDEPFLAFRREGDYAALDASLREVGAAEKTKFEDSLCALDTLLSVSRTSVELEAYGQFGAGPAFDDLLLFTKIEGDEDVSSSTEQAVLNRWKGGTAEVERAYLKDAFGPIQVEAGRDRFWWGPGRFGTLLVSSAGEPFDVLAICATAWRVRARYLTTVLSPEDGIYLSAHSLSFRLPLRTVVAVSEAVVYYRNSFPELQYVNPLVPYYLAEHNLRQDDNTLWDFSLVTLPGAGIRLYGELLIDDVQYERSAPAPDKLGGIAGFQVSDPLGLPDSDLRCEYTRLNKWVYTHRDSYNRYARAEVPIGDPLGPDSDRLILELCHRPTGVLEFLVGYRYLRHGEGSVDLPWEEEGGDPRPQFPSGKVEMHNSLFAESSYRPFWWLSLGSGVVYTRSRNSTVFGICPSKAVDTWHLQLDLRVDI